MTSQLNLGGDRSVSGDHSTFKDNCDLSALLKILDVRISFYLLAIFGIPSEIPLISLGNDFQSFLNGVHVFI